MRNLGRRLARLLLDEHAQQRFHLASVVVWVLLVAPALMWWRHSVLFVVFASIWANIVAHMSSALAARAGRRANPDDPL